MVIMCGEFLDFYVLEHNNSHTCILDIHTWYGLLCMCDRGTVFYILFNCKSKTVSMLNIDNLFIYKVWSFADTFKLSHTTTTSTSEEVSGPAYPSLLYISRKLKMRRDLKFPTFTCSLPSTTPPNQFWLCAEYEIVSVLQAHPSLL